MDFEKYTERSRGFIQSAQSLALREGHQRFTPEHLLKVLLDDDEGLAAGLIRAAGRRQPKLALRETEAALQAAEGLGRRCRAGLSGARNGARLRGRRKSSPRRPATASSPPSGCCRRWRSSRARRRRR